MRRILGRGFTNTALAAFEKNIASHVSKLCERLKHESQHGPVDLARWLSYFSLDVGAELSLGEKFETLDKDDNRHLFDTFGKAVKLVTMVPNTGAELTLAGRHTLVNAPLEVDPGTSPRTGRTNEDF